MDQLIAIASNGTYLSRWLVFVAGLRGLSVFLGYLVPARLSTNLFTRANRAGGVKQYTNLTGRTFAVWTLVTCAVCLFSAANLRNTPMLMLAVSSFAIADMYFAIELAAGTVSIPSIASPFIIASTSPIVCTLSQSTSDCSLPR